MLRSKFIYSLAILGSLYLVSCVTLANDKEETNQQLNQVQQAIAKQQAALKDTNKQRASILAQLKKDDKEIASIAKALNKTERSLEETAEKLVSLRKQEKQLIRDKKSQEALLGQQLRAAYSSGQHDYLKLLLNQEDASNVQRTLTYYQYLNNARIGEIEAFSATIEELAQVQQEYQSKTEQLNQLKVQQEQQQTGLKQQTAKRAKSVAQLNKTIESSNEKLARLQQEEQSLVSALKELEKLARKKPELKGLKHLRNKLTWPVKGRHLSRFGTRKQGYLKWKGVMIAAPVGRTVTTIHSGTVLFADWLKGYGLVIVIDNGEGYMSLYGHNQTLLKSVGDQVESGEPISLAGQSGGRAESGLYFEIRHQGKAVNPRLWCK